MSPYRRGREHHCRLVISYVGVFGNVPPQLMQNNPPTTIIGFWVLDSNQYDVLPLSDLQRRVSTGGKTKLIHTFDNWESERGVLNLAAVRSLQWEDCGRRGLPSLGCTIIISYPPGITRWRVRIVTVSARVSP